MAPRRQLRRHDGERRRCWFTYVIFLLRFAVQTPEERNIPVELFHPNGIPTLDPAELRAVSEYLIQLKLYVLLNKPP